MSVGEGVVLIDSPYMLIRAKHGNRFQHKKIKGIATGDKVWLFFSKEGKLKKVEKVEEPTGIVVNAPEVKTFLPEYDDEWVFGE